MNVRPPVHRWQWATRVPDRLHEAGVALPDVEWAPVPSSTPAERLRPAIDWLPDEFWSRAVWADISGRSSKLAVAARVIYRTRQPWIQRITIRSRPTVGAIGGLGLPDGLPAARPRVPFILVDATHATPNISGWPRVLRWAKVAAPTSFQSNS